MRVVEVKIKPKEDRLDKFLPKLSKKLSRSQSKKLIKEGSILVNDSKVDPDYSVKKGDKIKIEIPPPKPSYILPQNIPLKIIYEDESILVIDKKEGLVIHPTTDHPDLTLVNALLHYLKKKNLPTSGETLRPGIVHRLDKDTSGLLVIAKTNQALISLKNQFKSRLVEKKYLVLVGGKLEPMVGTIIKPIARHLKNRKKFTIAKEGKEAITQYKVLKYVGQSFSLLEAQPKTGRTHQLRVHFSHLGHPIVGDKLYKGKFAPRLFLHATYLGFVHPRSREKVFFDSPLPDSLNKILNKFEA